MDTPPPDGHQVTLPDVPIGARALIDDIDDTTPDHVAQRLRHLGFRAGNVVETVRVAPLGDPTVYRILGYEMCLRRQEAGHIRVHIQATVAS